MTIVIFLIKLFVEENVSYNYTKNVKNIKFRIKFQML